MTSRGVLGPQPARGRYSGVMFWLSRKTLSAVALALERHEPPVLSIAVDRARDVAFGIGNVVDVVHNRCGAALSAAAVPGTAASWSAASFQTLAAAA
jgi:hypothetical protein